jgi:hypothetical protein
MAKVFVSYSRKDIEFAKKLTGELQKSELDFWVDWEGIPPSVDWMRQIEKGIEEADTFIFILSPDSIQSKICKKEIEYAVKNGKRLIPIVTRDIKGDEAPQELSHLNWIFFREHDDFDAAIKKLMEGIHTDYEWVQTHRRLQVKALEWERNNHENSFLLRGKDLQDAEYQLATNTSKEPYPTDLQRDYVFKSRHAADRQRRITMGVSVAGIIALAVLAVFGFVQAGLATSNANKAKSQASTAQSASTLAVSNAATAVANEQEAIKQAHIAVARQLVTQAQSRFFNANSNQMTSVLLNIQSMKLFSNTDAASFLVNNNFSAHPISRMHHEYAVESVAFSSDGKYVVSGSPDKTARVWEAATGKEVARMPHDNWVTSVAFSPDGKYVVSGSQDYTARVWEAATGLEVARITHDDYVNSVAFSPDGKYVFSGSRNNTVRVWEVATGKEVTRMSHDDSVTSIAFSPDGIYIVSGSLDKTARVWDAATGKEVVRLPHDDFVNSVAFSPNGKYVASGSRITPLVSGKSLQEKK